MYTQSALCLVRVSAILRFCAQDEALTTLFLRAAEPGSSLAMSTAYLNLARSYEAALAAKPQVTPPLSNSILRQLTCVHCTASPSTEANAPFAPFP